ncbi:DUF1499 domain-containing protein [Pseudomonadales bacterium]|nr:DUF1499 domain-containing protein [Pseudomonadales bacterium]
MAKLPSGILARTITTGGLLLGIFGLGACSSQIGASLDGQDGRLSPCPAAPHCVTSEVDESASAYVAPIAMNGLTSQQARTLLISAMTEMQGQINTQTDRYLAASFKSKMFGFTDDLECRIDSAAGLIQVRSASRLGYYDMGANRRRVNELRQRFAVLRNSLVSVQS